MLLIKAYINAILLTVSTLFFAFSSEVKAHAPKGGVMSVEEFKNTINSDEFLRSENLTVSDEPFSEHELELIKIALANQNKNYGGVFEPGREINGFKGSTLLVGGGKTAGNCGENDGKTTLLDFQKEEKEITELIEKLSSGEWSSDPYTGQTFNSEAGKQRYISKLREKMVLYDEAFKKRNKDILNRYYILNIEDKIYPDMIGSINSKTDMEKIPDNKFLQVEFENVPCDVFLNGTLYSILERITKPGGTITFSISYACRRLIIPVIRPTKFGNQFLNTLKTEMYNSSKNMDADYGSCEITVTNG